MRGKLAGSLNFSFRYQVKLMADFTFDSLIHHDKFTLNIHESSVAESQPDKTIRDNPFERHYFIYIEFRYRIARTEIMDTDALHNICALIMDYLMDSQEPHELCYYTACVKSCEWVALETDNADNSSRTQRQLRKWYTWSLT